MSIRDYTFILELCRHPSNKKCSYFAICRCQFQRGQATQDDISSIGYPVLLVLCEWKLRYDGKSVQLLLVIPYWNYKTATFGSVAPFFIRRFGGGEAEYQAYFSTDFELKMFL